ncbi:hypothetical protein KUCAC02_023210, partial [Chaenocephalus aceratus]
RSPPPLQPLVFSSPEKEKIWTPDPGHATAGFLWAEPASPPPTGSGYTPQEGIGFTQHPGRRKSRDYQRDNPSGRGLLLPASTQSPLFFALLLPSVPSYFLSEAGGLEHSWA